MYTKRGNRVAEPRRKKAPSIEKQALFIAESITSRIEEGKDWNYQDYGISENPYMQRLVNEYMES